MGLEPTTLGTTTRCSNQLSYIYHNFLKQMVGARGFEPPAPWSQTRCANQTALRPDTHLYLKSGRNYIIYFRLCQEIFRKISKFLKLYQTIKRRTSTSISFFRNSSCFVAHSSSNNCVFHSKSHRYWVIGTSNSSIC